MTHYLYNGDQVLCEYEGDGNYANGTAARTFVYGPGIDEPVRMSIMPVMDVNGDGSSTMDDIYLMTAAWLQQSGDTYYNEAADLNHDGVVNNIDADILAGNWNVIRENRVHYYYHFDGLGSVTALSDKNGQTVETYKYSVFGQTAIYDGNGNRLAASAVGNVYFFTGRRLDIETGLYYYRARMYSPNLGRFLQTDPVGYEDSMCLYQYALNNPLIWIDPSGENVFGGFVSWIAGNGWDNSYDMGWGEAGEIAAGEAQAGATGYICALDQVVDTFVPVVHVAPYDYLAKKIAPSLLYTDSNGNILDDYRFSRAAGNLAGVSLSVAFSVNSLAKMGASGIQNLSGGLDDAIGIIGYNLGLMGAENANLLQQVYIALKLHKEYTNINEFFGDLKYMLELMMQEGDK